ncbi:MAG: aliphatic sulfonates transporter permease SsuC, partial [Bacillus sp. (in: firmicutes)]|nr:aliphatic sulfonates transporter permease SsuC [Bacillus sp. (in: firmicutes)]
MSKTKEVSLPSQSILKVRTPLFIKKRGKRVTTIQKQLIVMLRGLILPVAVVAIWQLVGSFGLVSKTLLPTPWAILGSFI